MPARVTVVGLGPAGADLLTAAARRALERIATRYVRTARHPAVAALAGEGLVLRAFDDRYDAASDLDAVYRAIVDELVAAATEHGDVLYAVPGSPTVAERTVAMLLDTPVELVVVPGVSFVDLACARLGIDRMARTVELVDAHDVRPALAGRRGALLLAQLDSALVLSEVKLALLDDLGPGHPVTVLAHLGLPDERVSVVALADLDRGSVVPDHLTSLYVDSGDEPVGAAMARLAELTETLRGPGGCPWDAQQTHHSLARHLLEEAYEVVEAIERLPLGAPGGSVDAAPGSYEALEDELGDLLFQVFIHSALAAEAGAFTVTDVARGIHAKLVRRHPHVFGDVAVAGAADVVRNWEQIKRAETGSASLVDGLPAALPALLLTPKLFRKAAAIGLDPSDAEPRRWLDEAVARLDGASPAELSAAVGELLAAVVAVARAHDVDAEAALRGYAQRFRARLRALERTAAAAGIDLERPDPVARELWATIPEMGG